MTFVVQVEAVQLVAEGTAPKVTQTDVGATYDPMVKKATAKINWEGATAWDVHNWIRGHDKVPGAWTQIDGQVSDSAL